MKNYADKGLYLSLDAEAVKIIILRNAELLNLIVTTYANKSGRVLQAG